MLQKVPLFNPFRVKNNGYERGERVNEGEHPNEDQVVNAILLKLEPFGHHARVKSGLQGERGREGSFPKAFACVASH